MSAPQWPEMGGAVKAAVARARPTLTNCLYYGTLFCGAELSQQLYLRKLLPWRQVSRWSSLMFLPVYHDIVPTYCRLHVSLPTDQ